MPGPTTAKKHIKVTVETFDVAEDGTETLRDRSVTESFNLELAEVVAMRKPLIEVAGAWNDGDAE